MSADGFPHLIQYRDPISGEQRSTVLCQGHERLLLRGLHGLAVGCIGFPADPSARCDRCEGAR